LDAIIQLDGTHCSHPRGDKGKPRAVYYFPRCKPDLLGSNYEDYCRVKLMLSHPFIVVEDLFLIDGHQAEAALLTRQ
jgi:hypothetical protein